MDWNNAWVENFCLLHQLVDLIGTKGKERRYVYRYALEVSRKRLVEDQLPRACSLDAQQPALLRKEMLLHQNGTNDSLPRTRSDTEMAVGKRDEICVERVVGCGREL